MFLKLDFNFVNESKKNNNKDEFSAGHYLNPLTLYLRLSKNILILFCLF